MVLNLAPSNADLLEPVIEEQEARFDEGGIERVLAVVRECVGDDDDDNNNNDNNDNNEGKGEDNKGDDGEDGGGDEMEGVER